MRIRALLLLLATPACVPWEQPAEPSSSTTTSGSTDAEPPDMTGWQVPARERGAGPAVTTTTSTTSTGATTSATTAEPDAPDTSTTAEPPPAIDLAALQIVEIHPDPAGKDGGPDSPEHLEILHVGSAPLPLAGLEIAARAWPTQTAEDLGLSDLVLEPGQRLLVSRYALAADLPDPALTLDETGIRVAFAADAGLRNADGGALLRSGEQIGDRMIYGAPQPAPWDEGWDGPPAPAPGSGGSLCRLTSEDHDSSSDWIVCSPSPGLPSEPVLDESTGADEDTGTTGEPLPAELAIVEVLSNPPGPGDQEKYAEFVEIENLGPGTVDLAGYTIADDLGEQPAGADPLLYLAGDGGCAPSTCLAPGQRAILVGNVYKGPLGPGLVLVTDDTTLANAGLAVHEPVALRDAEGALRSTYRAWADPLAAPSPALTEEALVRASAAAVDAPESWSFAAPTPGV